MFEMKIRSKRKKTYRILIHILRSVVHLFTMESETNLLKAFAFIVFDKNSYFSVITFVAVSWRYQIRLINLLALWRISCTDEYTICQAKQCYIETKKMWSWILQRDTDSHCHCLWSFRHFQSGPYESLYSPSAVFRCYYCYWSVRWFACIERAIEQFTHLRIVLCLVLSCLVSVCLSFPRLYLDVAIAASFFLSILFVFLRRFIVDTSV